MLNGEEPSELQVKAFSKALVLHADHELNASTFAARVTASTLTDLYSCVTTAIGTLKVLCMAVQTSGVFDMLLAIRESGDTEGYLQEKLDSKEKIMGFGHRVYKTVDPRQQYLKEMALDLTLGTDDEAFYQLSEEVEKFY